MSNSSGLGIAVGALALGAIAFFVMTNVTWEKGTVPDAGSNRSSGNSFERDSGLEDASPQEVVDNALQCFQGDDYDVALNKLMAMKGNSGKILSETVLRPIVMIDGKPEWHIDLQAEPGREFERLGWTPARVQAEGTIPFAAFRYLVAFERELNLFDGDGATLEKVEAGRAIINAVMRSDVFRERVRLMRVELASKMAIRRGRDEASVLLGDLDTPFRVVETDTNLKNRGYYHYLSNGDELLNELIKLCYQKMKQGE